MSQMSIQVLPRLLPDLDGVTIAGSTPVAPAFVTSPPCSVPPDAVEEVARTQRYSAVGPSSALRARNVLEASDGEADE